MTEVSGAVIQDAPGAHCFSDARARPSDPRRKIAPATRAHQLMFFHDVTRRVFFENAIRADFTFSTLRLHIQQTRRAKERVRTSFPVFPVYSIYMHLALKGDVSIASRL